LEKGKKLKKLKLPRLAYNWISSIGAMIAIASGFVVISMLIFSTFMEMTNPYLGIFSYMVMPAFLIFGLILIPIGMLNFKRRRRKKGYVPGSKWPVLDLNKKRHRNALYIFVIGTFIFVGLTTFGSYEAFHFSESITFCGTTCHVLMEPEFVAYQNSPHARVACVECHVGPGAGWYTKAKLSGAYQVYATLFNKYPRPIPTPIENLRPAQETCEQCHWPEKFFGAQQQRFNHFMYDEESTAWPINMLIKIGGGDPQSKQTSGIHWHMNIGNKVEYIARDGKHQDIPWVKFTDLSTGLFTIYQDNENPLTDEEIKTATPRLMDCVDCHNRPSHIYKSPDEAIDLAILTGRIDGSIPEIKRVAVELMSEEYESRIEAVENIAKNIRIFYAENYPEIYEQKREVLDSVIISTQTAYSENIFPDMKVRWSEYPDNIGHFTSIGCMRCHLGNHETETGEKITHDCQACHIILSQGSGEFAENSTSEEGLEFKHPEDIDEAWKEMGCYECHSGTQP
jgi:NapC/NirT cytochrome c family, N-terminal region